MHGLGNDYIIIDESQGEIIPENQKPAVASRLCRRGFSIGGDGMIFVSRSSLDKVPVRFRIFNSDGSEAEMCGNGIRCFGKYVYEKGLVSQDTFMVETKVGLKKLELELKNNTVKSIRVNMGLSTFNTPEIPMKTAEKEFIDETLLVDDESYQMTVLSVGNPHAIIFTKDLEKIPLSTIGPRIENHPAFPHKINVHFVEIIGKNEIKMITWERGVGVTLACGTGATACVIAGCRLGLLADNVLVHLPGGDLIVETYQKEDKIGALMSGDAEIVFEGQINIDF